MSRAVGAAPATDRAGGSTAGDGKASVGGRGAAIAEPARLGQDDGTVWLGAAATGRAGGVGARSPKEGGKSSCERGNSAGAARTPLPAGATGGVGSTGGMAKAGGARANCGDGGVNCEATSGAAGSWGAATGPGTGGAIKRERGISSGAGRTTDGGAAAIWGRRRTGGAAAI